MLDALQETGIQLFASGSYEEAARHFATALLREERAELWNDWASARTAGGHLLEALEGFRCASLLEPDNAEVRTNFAALTQALEQRRAAINSKWSIQDRSAMRRTAITCFQNGQQEEAGQILQELLLMAESAELWNDLGTVHVAVGNFVDAELAYRRALVLDNSNATATSNLVVLLERTERHGKAAVWKNTGSANVSAKVCGPIGPHASRQRGAQIVSELMAAISALPSYPPDMPVEMAEALAVNRSDSSYFVAHCRKLVEDIPAEWKMNAWTELANNADSDYRMNLAIGAALLDQRDYEAALPLIQTAFDANPLDLYADRLLDRCVNGMAGDETATDKYLSTHFCSDPWKHFEISQTGHVYQCCPGWLTVPVGKMGEASAEELWNSRVAQEVRSSIADGSFKFCSRSHCPKIAGRTLPPKPVIQIENVSETAAHLAPVLTLPKKLVLAYDRTCNLACPQCRSDFVIASPGRRNEMDSYIPAILEIAEQANALHLNGSGELFGSRHTRELLQLITRERFPLLKFHIISNGQLFDRRAYEQFDLQGRIGSLQISVDAATAETYSIVRFPGNFDRLLKNLRFLDDLRLNEHQHFSLNLCFVVSGKNYKEMPDFVRLGRSLHADAITFTRFRNWGSFTTEEFNKMNITDPAHPEHQDFLNVLEHPELLDPAVDLGSVRSFRRATNSAPSLSADQSPEPNHPAQEHSHSSTDVSNIDNGPERFLEAALSGGPHATELWTRFVICLTRKLDAMGDGPRPTAEKVNIAGYFISAFLRNFYKGPAEEFFWRAGDLRNTVFHLAESLGLHILPTHFYSPVPVAPQLSSRLWEHPSTLPGIDMNDSGQLELLNAFSKFRQECDSLPVRKPAGSPPHAFFLENGSYQSIDAEVLYSMVRHFKPRRICEIGSGNSTLLSAQAIAAYRKDDSAYTCELTAIEPYPNEVLKAGFPGLTRLVQAPVQDMPFSEFARLDENDILFIDSSHVLRIGNDVQHEFLEILPRLKKGVLIHIHDIFLPFEYPAEWVMKMNRYWTEQYLLQAFLIGNRAFEVVSAGSYLHAKHADALEAAFSRYRKGQSWSPGYFWMRKVE